MKTSAPRTSFTARSLHKPRPGSAMTAICCQASMGARQRPAAIVTHITCSAFTVAELGEMLPARLEYSRPKDPTYRLAMEKQDRSWNVVYICADCGGRNFEPMLADTEADARAKMLIYLLETARGRSLPNAMAFVGRTIATEAPGLPVSASGSTALSR
jgi:hypothetical protein